MGQKNRRTAGISSALILLAAIILCGIYLFQLNRQKTETVNAVKVLEKEQEELQTSIENTKYRIQTLDEEILAIPQKTESLAERKQAYYTVCKELEDAVLEGSADCKIAYLTFDDGPISGMTDRFLDVLKEYNVLGTFFMVGRPYDSVAPLYERVYAEGHTIGNHSYSHTKKDGIYASVDAFIEDILKNRKLVEDKVGYTTTILRFPYGSSYAGSMKPAIMEELRKLGYGYTDWDSTTGDGTQSLSAEEYTANVLDHTDGRSVIVVLMHEYSENTLTALPDIIQGLREQGYVLLPLFYESIKVNK